jgi:hypothetical protein
MILRQGMELIGKLAEGFFVGRENWSGTGFSPTVARLRG